MLQIAKDLISMPFYASSFMPYNHRAALVLVYHSISEMDLRNDPYRVNLNPTLFKKQIKFLAPARKQNIIFTFDDGFENFFYNAFPLVLRYNIKTLLFITVDFINGNMSFDHLFGPSVKLRPLQWRQLREIADSGIEIGSHTKSHPNLTLLDNETLRKELADSKKIIEDAIGKQVKYFAYPYGSKVSFNKRIKDMVREIGYEKAYTNIMGFNAREPDLYELRRIRVYSNDNILRFKMKIRGAYNWIDRVNTLLENSSYAKE